ncbi:Sterol esterase [Pleurostoma richardsiae]|uniref:Carboxylic ester hydrolase n=1 Tax=Pleurostoma richardsiae TaxID=41990 RepID=A0AA38RWY9_9PEZI|nr:Sterol esterase [Pleurostoma richardsiae]
MVPAAEKTPREVLLHPTIGSIRGVCTFPGVVQYLGIQYATLKDRFSRGELKQNHPGGPDGVLNATELGPIPLSPPNGCEHEHLLIQKSLPYSPFRQSDTQCLTLNITAPRSCDSSRAPVLVFVHGGAFATGSSSYPQYDLGPITHMSVEMGTPIVAVGINYRVGAPGFLHSAAMRDAGYKINNGLNDQKLALRWIKRNIAGFGGDPDKVTLVGESAGGVSGCFHLQSAEPLFHQLVAMSGSSLQRLRRPEQAEKSYTSVIEAIGAKELPPREQLQRLLDTPKEDLLSKVGRRFPIGPLLDGDSIPETTTFDSLRDGEKFVKLFPGVHYCRRVMMGDCQMDGMAFNSRVSGRVDILSKTLRDCLATVFDPIDVKITPSIVSAYGLDTTAASNAAETIEPVLNFGNDVMFALPARAFARAWSSSGLPGAEAFLCHFNCPNPWDGPWKGHATHIQDIAFVLQNYRDSLSVGQRRCAERYARDIIAFVNTAPPWPAYHHGVKPGSMVYFAPEEGDIDQSQFVSDEAPERTGRRDILQRLVPEEMSDKLVDVWQMFMLGPQ